MGRMPDELIARLAALTRQKRELEERIAWAERHGYPVPPLQRDPALGPELPNGEGIVGLTASEVEQGREAPRTCEPGAPGDGM